MWVDCRIGKLFFMYEFLSPNIAISPSSHSDSAKMRKEGCQKGELELCGSTRICSSVKEVKCSNCHPTPQIPGSTRCLNSLHYWSRAFLVHQSVSFLLDCWPGDDGLKFLQIFVYCPCPCYCALCNVRVHWRRSIPLLLHEGRKFSSIWKQMRGNQWAFVYRRSSDKLLFPVCHFDLKF